ncbi:MAG: 4-hydroxy-tetrahydrodipicolinate synthase [Candidatus Cloacimonas sp.]|nr:4-hydroxy-tetrahydrodipicolinate synthase [Candidatus Cloacimonadota bacterium]
MIKGSIVALVTPFKNNDIDYNAVDKLIDFHLENKTDGILINGTTGESPTLASDEKEYYFRYVIQKVNGVVPIMIGTGTKNLPKTIAETVKAKRLGADYALVITPYYNKPTQNGLYHYYKRVHDETDIPIVIYNVPGRTGVNITAETVVKIANDCERVIGLKEAAGNLTQLTEVVKYAPKNFSVLSGEDALNLPSMSCGAVGTISVTANVVPKQMHDMINLSLNGKYEEALKIHLELHEINKMMFVETNPIPVKEALHMMGLIERELRLPLYYLEPKNLENLKTLLEKHNLI